MRVLDRLSRAADGVALGLTDALMKATYDAPEAGGGYLGRALGAGRPQPTALGAAAWHALAGRLRSAMGACLEDEVAEEFLKTLLRLMQIALVVDPAYRHEIAGFQGRYRFQSKDRDVEVGVTFQDGWMHVREGRIEAPNVNVSFASGRALIDFLLTPNPDVLVSMLHGEVQTDGNLNYLYKFARLAKRLQALFPAA